MELFRWDEDDSMCLLTVRGGIVNTVCDKQIEIYPLSDTEDLPDRSLTLEQIDACKALADAVALKNNSKTDLGRYWRTLINDIDEKGEKPVNVFCRYYDAFRECNEHKKEFRLLEDNDLLAHWPERKIGAMKAYATSL